MDTISRGNAAEAAVLNAFIQAGIGVSVPFGDGSYFDLIALLPDDTLARIQVKSGRIRRQTIEFNSASTDHGRGRQPYRGRVEYFAVHAHQLDRLFMVPADQCAKYKAYLRLVLPANNYRTGILMADDFDFGRWAKSINAPGVPALAVADLE
jgi:hypothetical protein